MNVFITRKIPQTAIDLLVNEGFDVSVYGKDNAAGKNILMKQTKDADGVITLLNDRIDAEIIANMTRCRVIANYAVGYNNIDIEAADKKKIIVTNTPDVLTESTADLAVTLLLACSRRILEGHSMVVNGKFNGWKPELLLGVELKNKYAGIIGAGRIGTAAAKRLKAFGCKIIYFSRKRNPSLENETGAKKVNLDTLLKKSDFVSIHVPLNSETKFLLDKEKLSLLKPSAIIINTARGEILDETALIQMLKEKKLFAAGFDVYTNEPEINKKLLKLKNVVLLPHLGSATVEARGEMALLAAKNVINVLKGRKALTPVLSKNR